MTETYEERNLRELEEARTWVEDVLKGICPNENQPNDEAIAQLSNLRFEIFLEDRFLLGAVLAGIPMSYLRTWVPPNFADDLELQLQKVIKKISDLFGTNKKVNKLGEFYEEIKRTRYEWNKIFREGKYELFERYKKVSTKKQTKTPQPKVNKPEPLLPWAIFLDQLPDEYIPIPWLVDGLIRVGERSDMYGQAGAGKTYLALDMGFAIAQGKPWMGRNTLEGLVLYIASENPQSVEARMKAYRTHLNYKGESLCIYKKPFDLFNSDSDSNDLIEFINTASKTKGKPFRLIIFDTLSKVMVGANENLTADMNKVMAKIDRIISNAQAHCMVLHHSGKDPSKGARGSNSLLGAIDTELKVDRLQSSRYIEVTKQRDGNDGERIGFDIQSTNLKDQDGNPILNEKGEPINFAIVVAKDSPTNLTRATRVNKIEKAILSDLENTEGLNRTLLVKAIADKVGHKKPNHVYKKLADLVSIGKVMQTERDGELWVSLATPS
jgi:hypothetical protein